MLLRLFASLSLLTSFLLALDKRRLHPSEKRRLQSNLPAPTLPGPYNFLLRDFRPLVNCTVGNTSAAAFDGYTVELMNQIFTDFNWNYGTDYTFECVTDIESIHQRISNPGPQKIIGEGALQMNSTWTQNGVQFSQPTYSSGLRMVVRQKNIRNMWSFAQPISWRVGLGLVISCAIVGVLIWIFEEKKWRRPKKSEHVLNLVEVLYDVFSSFFATNSITLRKWASKLLQWFTWVYVIIFVALYQADLTGKLSSSYFELEFDSYADALANVQNPIATLDVYRLTNQLNNTSFQYRVQGTQAREDLLTQMFTDLTNGVIDALIVETPLVEFYMPQYCSLFMLDDIILSFPYATAFSSTIDQSLIFAYTQSLTKWQESQTVRAIKKQMFDSGNNPDCSSDSNVITIDELGGLWIILGATAAIAVVLFIMRKCGWCKTPSNYMPPYYEYYNEKTQLFEEQLKEAVHTELKKISKNYYEHIEQEIQTFEDTLMLQDNVGSYDKKEEVVEINEPKVKKIFKTFRVDDKKGDIVVDPKDIKFHDDDRF